MTAISTLVDLVALTTIAIESGLACTRVRAFCIETSCIFIALIVPSETLVFIYENAYLEIFATQYLH